MQRKQWIVLFLLAVSLAVSVGFGIPIGRSVPGGAVDLQVIYYATKCLLQGHDPYDLDQLRSLYVAQNQKQPPVPTENPQLVARYIYLPPSFVLMAPLALLPWALARLVWTLLPMGFLFGGAALIVREARDKCPWIACLLACVLLANCQMGFALGNTGVLVASLCTVATWCFLRQKYLGLSVLLFLCPLILKPHNGALLCFFFLFASSSHRKRALMVLALFIACGLASLIWVSHVSPNWFQEWRINVGSEAVHGGISDPGPSGEMSHGAGQVIDLQAALSILKDEPAIYNPASYAVCGALTLVWTWRTLRAKFSLRTGWLAIAAAVPLTLLPTYHRPYDAKLLLLVIPACALLWHEGGGRKWIGAGVTMAAIVCTADLPLVVLSSATAHIDVGAMGFIGRLCLLPVVRPAPVALLATAVFYLWVYLRSSGSSPAPSAALPSMPTAD